MAAKGPAPQVHASRRDQVPGEPRRKKQKPDYVGPKSFKKAHPVNELKSQIRSLKRMLTKNENLPANVRVEKERALRTAQYELDEAEKAKQRNEMIARYHKVRFFDRQNASKRLKRARRELQSLRDDANGRDELARRMEEFEVDVNYARYYPLDQHYVPLFPRKKTKLDQEAEDSGDEAQSRGREGDAEMWQRVKQCMGDRTLDALRNGRLTRPQRDAEQATSTGLLKKSRQKQGRGDPPHPKDEHPGGKHPDKKGAEPEDEEDASDGGFFE